MKPPHGKSRVPLAQAPKNRLSRVYGELNGPEIKKGSTACHSSLLLVPYRGAKDADEGRGPSCQHNTSLLKKINRVI